MRRFPYRDLDGQFRPINHTHTMPAKKLATKTVSTTKDVEPTIDELAALEKEIAAKEAIAKATAKLNALDAMNDSLLEAAAYLDRMHLLQLHEAEEMFSFND